MRFDKEVLPEADFQDKVLSGIEAQQKKVEKLSENYDQLDKTTKSAVEELTKLKNGQGTIEEIQRSLQKVNLQMTREKRMAFGNPLERIINDDEKRTRFNAAVRLACARNGDTVKLAMEMTKGLVQKDAGEDTGFGATLITPDLAKDIYDTLALFGAWNTLGVRNLGTKVTKLPIKTARALAQWIGTEGATIAGDTTKAGTSVNLTAEPIAVLLAVSMQLLEDADVDVTADIMDDFVEAWNERLDYTAFSGNNNNAGNDGGQTGLFYGGTAVTAATTHTTAETLTLQDFLNTQVAVDVGVLARPCRWWIHPFMLTRILNIKDTTGRPIFLTILERPAPNALGSILGYPVTLVNNAPSTDVTG
jgi:HK97 family phage major capsid protein